MSRISAVSLASLALASLLQGACSRTASTNTPRPIEVWTLPAPSISSPPGADASGVASLIEIDSVSLRAVEVRKGAGVALITNYQGGRYHPETVRSLAIDSVVLDRFATRLVSGAARDKRIILDFQFSTPDDLPELAAVARAVGLVSRASGQTSLSLIVPAQDTSAYPTLVLARLAEMLIVRLDGEHRPGTPAGPPVTPDFITRSIGVRARLIGASRIGVEIPLFGYLWQRGGNVAPITFARAQELVRSESGVLTRDPPSQFLTASGRDGWTLWVPDARTVQFIADVARRRGVASFHLAGPDGADPEIFLQGRRLIAASQARR